MSDVSSVLIWWLTIFITGMIFLPVTFQIFQKFADRGYIFTKVIGILFSSYLIWLLGSLKILPFTNITIIITLIGWALANMYLLGRLRKKGLLTNLPFRLIIFEELLFLLTLSFWSYVKAAEPSIHGLEKFMDFGFVNSILRSDYFPPPDMWLAKSPDYAGGYFINYYYFGHYIAAFLTKLSGIDSAVTYNLMLATLFAFTFTLSFSLGLNLYYLYILIKSKIEQISKLLDIKITLKKALLAGFLSAFLVTFAGNLHTIYILTSNYPLDNPLPPWKLELGIYPERYWYPNATRFIPFTIHEFPIYSFVVADLHGHVSDIPFVLLFFAILLTIVIPPDKKEKQDPDMSGLGKLFSEFWEHTSVTLPRILLLGILLSVMYMTNAWDGLIYMIFVGLVFLYINIRKTTYDKSFSFYQAIYSTFSASLFLVFFFLLANLPFSLNFRPFVSGIGVLCAPKFLLGKKLGPFLFEAGKCQKSPVWMLMFLWGFFYYNIFGFLVFVIFPRLKTSFFHSHDTPPLPPKNSRIHTNRLFILIRQIVKAVGKLFLQSNPVNIFILIFISISTLLLIFPEYLYMKDIYPAHYRANTMFKLGYQAFMMLGLVSAFVVLKISDIFNERFIKVDENKLKKFPKWMIKMLFIIIISNACIWIIMDFLKTTDYGDMTKITILRWLFAFMNIFFFGNFVNQIIRIRRLTLNKTSFCYLLWFIFFYICFFFVGIYPYFAINSYYSGLKTYHGLDGLNWLTTQYADDFKAIQWLRSNVKCNDVTQIQCSNHPVIVEASGDSYTDYARVSANTGLPTIVGWPVHEWLWRGSYDEAGKRIPEVQAIYESKDMKLTREILQKYDVQYIFIGSLEREKYKNLDMDKILKLGKLVFESGETKVIKVNPISP